ncbi:MAG: four helix bundle protein [Kiritimatiellae bacterium]|nr:four helix bundle protein [Kiritimatiellia bacterium]
MRDHTKLKAFQIADEIALMVYQVTRDFPKEEMYGMTAQIRRAAVSVPSNIVEGCARQSQGEYVRFLDIAFGSLREMGYQMSLAVRLGYVPVAEATACTDKIVENEKVLSGLIRSMR